MKNWNGQTLRIVRERITEETELFSLKTLKTMIKKMD